MGVRGKELSAREMLLELDVPSFLATMAVPFMFFMPGTTDPDSASVIEIIKGLQKGLRKLGHKNVRVNGIFDVATVNALNLVSPPAGSWQEKTWVQLYGDVITAKKNPVRREVQLLAETLGDYGPLPGRGRTVPGGLGFYQDLGASAADGGVYLTWGLGVKSKSNCVPVDAPTKAAFQGLQRQINRLLGFIKQSTISEDGVIGRGTLTALKKLIFLVGPLPVDNCTQVAQKAISIGTKLRSKANSLGVSQSASPGPAPRVRESAGPPLTTAQADALAGQKGLAAYAPWLLLAGGTAVAFAMLRKGKR